MEDNETIREPPDQISKPDCETISTTLVPNYDADLDNKSQRKIPETKDGGGIPRVDIEMESIGEPKPTDPMVVGDKEEKEEEEKEGEEQDTPTAPDGGYGWFIVLGSFLAHIILGSTERCEGIYFLEFQKKFNKSAQLTAWPVAITAAIHSFLGPLASALSIRYSVRSVCLVSTIFLFLAYLLNGFAPDFSFLFFSHSLLEGIGGGLLYAPSTTLVGMYFDKRRGLATGIAVSGTGVGTFVIVPVVQMLFETYGYQAAFVLIAAFCLNAAVSAMLYRPLSLYYKFEEGRIKKEGGGINNQNGHVAATFVDYVNVQKDNETTKEKRINGCFKSAMKIIFPREISRKQKSKKGLFNLHLLKNPTFLTFCLSFLLYVAAFNSAIIFLPSLITSFGFTEADSALVLSIYGVADTIGRVVFGVLFDLGPVRRYRTVFHNGLVYCIAIVSTMLPLFNNYTALCFISAVYGILTGGYISQLSIIALDILGVANIASSFGLLIVFQGIGVLIGPPLSGALKDVTGSFIPLFYMGGGLMLCAGFLMVVSNIFLWRQRRREEEAIHI